MTTTLIEIRNEVSGFVKTLTCPQPKCVVEARLREALAQSPTNTDVVGAVVHVLPDRVVLRLYPIGDPDVAREAVQRYLEAQGVVA